MFIFVATNRVRPDRLEDERRRVPGWVEFIESQEPRLIAFHEFLDPKRLEVTYVQVHPDAANFEHHLKLLQQEGGSYEATLESTTDIRIYGSPTEHILKTLRQAVGPHVPILVVPTHLGGFTRK